jgi:NAD(P)-dependent dehydrogenase (short-subunit alcohol dehydrogenase family)
MRDFSGKVAVITGAASGIGRALAAELAQRGCDLAIVDINDDGLQGTERLVSDAGRRVTRHVVDVSDREAMEALPETVVAAHGVVDIVVNNAGVSVAATLEDHSIEDFEWLVGINFWGVVYGSKFFLPYLRRSDDAYIVNMSSMFGLVGVPGQSSYCATKFAVRGFSEAIAAELADTPIRVLSVHPGGISTNIARATRWAASHAGLRDKTVRFFEQRTMPADKAALRIVEAMRRGRGRVLIGAEAYLTDYVKRAVPVLPPRVLDWARRRLGPR